MNRWTSAARFVVANAAAVVLVGLLTSCDNLPTAPTRPTGPIGPGGIPQLSPISFSGLVSDTAWRTVANARVEVVDGPGVGAFAVTDASGRFELLGIRSGAIAVRASKDGYVPQTRRPVSDSILFDDMG
jgi:hypothetical protein